MKLTTFEILHAAQAGIARNVTAIRDRRPLEEGRVDSGWERHIDGAIGEYVVAKTLGRCWSPSVGILDTETGDVGNVQVKTTTLQEGCLVVRPHDPPAFDYYLVILALPHAHVRGWTTGGFAKTPPFWRPEGNGVHRAAYFVPQSELVEILPAAGRPGP